MSESYFSQAGRDEPWPEKISDVIDSKTGEPKPPWQSAWPDLHTEEQRMNAGSNEVSDGNNNQDDKREPEHPQQERSDPEGPEPEDTAEEEEAEEALRVLSDVVAEFQSALRGATRELMGFTREVRMAREHIVDWKGAWGSGLLDDKELDEAAIKAGLPELTANDMRRHFAPAHTMDFKDTCPVHGTPLQRGRCSKCLAGVDERSPLQRSEDQLAKAWTDPTKSLDESSPLEQALKNDGSNPPYHEGLHRAFDVDQPEPPRHPHDHTGLVSTSQGPISQESNVPRKSPLVETGPACKCGGLMQRTGSCWTCPSCGENTGCG